VNGGTTPVQLADQAAGVSQVNTNAPANLQMANKTQDELSKLLMAELHKFFKPELLNRFDDLVMFKPLEKKDMMQIAKLGIKKTEKLLKEQGFGVTISDAALAQLAEEGYDPVYGARPLRRLIQSSIENPIALLIINRTFSSGDTILIDYDKQNQKFVFTKAQPQTAQPPQNSGSTASTLAQNGVSAPTSATQPQPPMPQAGVTAPVSNPAVSQTPPPPVARTAL
jgi:ATP-dependent Clp protease ATP-binding subunit ClpB